MIHGSFLSVIIYNLKMSDDIFSDEKHDTSESLLNLILERIHQLENDTDSLIYKKATIADFQFHLRNEYTTNGLWYDINSGRPKVVRLIGELAYDLTPYADIRSEEYVASVRYLFPSMNLPIILNRLMNLVSKVLNGDGFCEHQPH